MQDVDYLLQVPAGTKKTPVPEAVTGPPTFPAIESILMTPVPVVVKPKAVAVAGLTAILLFRVKHRVDGLGVPELKV